MTNIAFESFNCWKFDVDAEGNAEYYLVADVGIRCSDRSTNATNGTAWLAVCLYPIGTVLLTWGLLRSCEEAIIYRKPSTLSTALAFLHEDLKPYFYWWELAEMLRRFVLVGLLSVVAPGTVLQLVIGNLFCIAYLIVQVQANPFRNSSDDYMAVVCSAALAICFMLCLVFKFSNLTELDDINEQMSSEQRRVYAPREVLLAFIMIATLLATLATSIAIGYVNVRMERFRLRQEDLASRARRLRYVRTSLSVPAPPLPAEMRYHVFLSQYADAGLEHAAQCAPRPTAAPRVN